MLRRPREMSQPMRMPLDADKTGRAVAVIRSHIESSRTRMLAELANPAIAP